MATTEEFLAVIPTTETWILEAGLKSGKYQSVYPTAINAVIEELARRNNPGENMTSKAGYAEAQKKKAQQIADARATSAKLTADAAQATAALRQAGYTYDQINAMKAGTSRAGVIAVAETNTTYKRGDVVTAGKNPILLYAGVALVAVGVFYFAGKKRR